MTGNNLSLIETLTAEAMETSHRMLTRGAKHENIVFVMTPDVFYGLSHRNEFLYSRQEGFDGDGIIGKYYGIPIFVVDPRAGSEPICLASFYYSMNCIEVPIQNGDYILFEGHDELYKVSVTGETEPQLVHRIFDTGIRVQDRIKHKALENLTELIVKEMPHETFDEIKTYFIENPGVFSSSYGRYEWTPNPFEVVNTAGVSGRGYWARAPYKKSAVKWIEPELQTTPELDEFIEQFRRN